MRSIKFVLVIAATMFSAGIAHSQQVYKVGTGVVPFGFSDPKTNSTQGYSVDIMNGISRDAGFQVQFTGFASFGQILPALVSKQIDIDASSTTITPERKAMGADFSDVYAIWTECLVVARNDSTQYKSLDDLKGQVMGAGVGTIYLDDLKAKGGFKDVKAFATLEAATNALKSGEIKAYLTNAAQMTYLQRQGQYQDVLVVRSYVPVYHSSGGIAVRRGETELLNKINASLRKLKANGTVKTLADKWGIVPPT
ncbi:MAG TPA: ABC transporter substrate-binding protein [Xanthobacteraceae bacterium]